MENECCLFEEEMIHISKEIQNEQNVRERILAEMKDGLFSQCERLPRETVLSEEMGISRTQLRDVLAAMEQEGFITRRLGVGTIINRHVLNVKSRMDIEAELLDVIRDNGYETRAKVLGIVEETAKGMVADKLGIEEGTPIIKVSKVCTADGIPALYFQDLFDKRLIKKEYTEKDFEYPIFRFLEEKCNTEAYMDLTQLNAVSAEGEIAEILKVPVGTPLLNMEEVDYSIEGNIVFYSRQFFINGMFEQTVLRKKLY